MFFITEFCAESIGNILESLKARGSSAAERGEIKFYFTTNSGRPIWKMTWPISENLMNLMSAHE